MQCHLVVHETSLPYIRKLVDFLRTAMTAEHGSLAFHVVAERVEDARIEAPAIVYVIGEQLPPFPRRAGIFHAYLNFSVVAPIGNPFAMSLGGAALIWRKRQMLKRKLASVDAVLDYYPAQTRALQRRLAIPVLGFLPCSSPPDRDPLPLEQREFDLCFVGGVSPRRQRVLDQARAVGLSLSPERGADLEVLSARSRLTLNVHMKASNHLEIPRIIGALSTHTPVVTENSYGLAEIVDSDSVRPGRARDLVAMAKVLLEDRATLHRLETEAAKAFKAYHARATRQMAETCRDVAALAAAQTVGSSLSAAA
jgi:hypothetical protein